MSELKPCPFCGGTNLRCDGYLSLGFRGFYIRCLDCEASSTPKGTEQAAIEAWNRRADDDRTRKKGVKEKWCKGYCGVACVDGSCPVANREEYAERGYDIVHNCNECHYYNGCDDCCFDGTEMCANSTEKGGEKE